MRHRHRCDWDCTDLSGWYSWRIPCGPQPARPSLFSAGSRGAVGSRTATTHGRPAGCTTPNTGRAGMPGFGGVWELDGAAVGRPIRLRKTRVGGRSSIGLWLDQSSPIAFPFGSRLGHDPPFRPRRRPPHARPRIARSSPAWLGYFSIAATSSARTLVHSRSTRSHRARRIDRTSGRLPWTTPRAY